MAGKPSNPASILGTGKASRLPVSLPTLLFGGCQGSFQGLKQLKREADKFPSYST